MYTATLTSFGKKYSATGDTVIDAVSGIEVKGVVRGKGILSVARGESVKERILTPFLTARLFSKSPTIREVALKNTAILFDGV